MEDSKPRNMVRSGLYTAASASAFQDSTRLAREWIIDQAEQWQIPSPDFSVGLSTGTSSSARLITQTELDKFAFALSHADGRIRTIEWKILGSITEIDGRCFVDVAIDVTGVWPSVVPPLGMPGFMASIVQQIGMTDLWPLSLEARHITVESAADFVDFLRSSQRRLPVIALSEPSPIPPDEIKRICRRVAGAAHVVVVETPASFAISDRMGKDFSVYRGAVRVYHPRLSTSPYDVPLFFSQTIERINNSGRQNGPFGTIRFADILVRTGLDRSKWPPKYDVVDTVITSPADVPENTAEPFTSKTIALVSETPVVNAFAGDTDVTVRDVDGDGHLFVAALSPEITAHDIVDEPAVATQEAGEALNALDIAEGRVADTPPETQDELEKLRDELESERAEKEQYFEYYVLLEQELKLLKNGSVSGLNSEVIGASEKDLDVLRMLANAHADMKAIIERGVAAQIESQNLREQVEQLELDGRKKNYLIDQLRPPGKSTEEEVGIAERPMTYNDIPELERYLAAKHGDHLILHTNAKRTLEAGVYQDIDHLIDLLDLLGQQHYNMKMSVARAYEAFEAERERLFVKYSKVLSPTSVGNFGRHYEVQWNGKTVAAMDIWHVRNNATTFDPRRMAALYFFWDDDLHATVVTSGPDKLPTPADYT